MPNFPKTLHVAGDLNVPWSRGDDADNVVVSRDALRLLVNCGKVLLSLKQYGRTNREEQWRKMDDMTEDQEGMIYEAIAQGDEAVTTTILPSTSILRP